VGVLHMGVWVYGVYAMSASGCATLGCATHGCMGCANLSTVDRLRQSVKMVRTLTPES